jgi:hypothetical protein
VYKLSNPYVVFILVGCFVFEDGLRCELMNCMERKPYKLPALPAGVEDNWISEQNRTGEVR